MLLPGQARRAAREYGDSSGVPSESKYRPPVLSRFSVYLLASIRVATVEKPTGWSVFRLLFVAASVIRRHW